MTHQHCSLEDVLHTFMHQFGDGILCTLLPNHNVHRENGLYQQQTTNALKSKSVSEMHFSAIWGPKFTDLANKTVKKTQSLGKNSCRQKCLDKGLCMHTLLQKRIYENTAFKDMTGCQRDISALQMKCFCFWPNIDRLRSILFN